VTTNAFRISVGERVVELVIDGGPVKVVKLVIDGQVVVDEPTAPKATRKATAEDRKASRERAALLFLARVSGLIQPPLSAAQRQYWRDRADSMAGFIRSGHPFGRVREREALFRELCGVVANATVFTSARSSARLPWYAPVLGLSAWPVGASELRDAYRKLALERHPDRGGSNADFIALQKAHDAAKAALGVA
jgi:hypothetical protein